MLAPGWECMCLGQKRCAPGDRKSRRAANRRDKDTDLTGWKSDGPFFSTCVCRRMVKVIRVWETNAIKLCCEGKSKSMQDGH